MATTHNNIDNDLIAINYRKGGGMLGAYYQISIKKSTNNLFITTASKTIHYEEEVNCSYQLESDLLKDINKLIVDTRLLKQKDKPLLPLVLDGEIESLQFVFNSKYYNLESNQEFSDGARTTFKEIISLIKAVVNNLEG